MLQGCFFRRLAELRKSQCRAPELPFTDALSEQSVLDLAAELKVEFRDRLFTPLVTLWVFLAQVLDPDQSCRQALARLAAFLARQGRSSCSTRSGSYCNARQRLPEQLFQRLLQKTGKELQGQTPAAWLFHGRTVKIVDGTTVSMPDTAANAQAFDKPRNQKGASAFPVARVVVLLCWATGVALDVAIGPYRGKMTGELSLFRGLDSNLQSGEILLGDRLFCNYADIARLRARNVDVVLRLSAARHVDFRRGKRLGPSDHRLVWRKSTKLPTGMTPEDFAALPMELEMREVCLVIRIPGFRIRKLVVATTLLDDSTFSVKALTDLYRDRWQAELNLRSIKTVMHMDVLRCRSPEMVRKEIQAHLLAYNLLRSLMCTTAREFDRPLVTISFKASLQILLAFCSELWHGPPATILALRHHLLHALNEHRVHDRLNRTEPRKVKRRPKPYPRLQKPRHVEQNLCRLGRSS
jgi:hypothetical protein